MKISKEQATLIRKSAKRKDFAYLADKYGVTTAYISRIARGTQRNKRTTKPSHHMSAVDRFWIRVKKTDTCWLWQGRPKAKKNQEHCRFTVNKEQIFVHRFAYELFIGPIPTGLQVLHSCDVPKCVNPDHLFLGTQKDNILDMCSKGRAVPPKGEINGRAILKESDVMDIRQNYKKVKTKILAAKYGVSIHHIKAVANKRAWKHL